MMDLLAERVVQLGGTAWAGSSPPGTVPGSSSVVSPPGADRQSRVFYNRVKGEVEEAVRKLPFDGVHIFRPSLLGDEQ